MGGGKYFLLTLYLQFVILFFYIYLMKLSYFIMMKQTFILHNVAKFLLIVVLFLCFGDVNLSAQVVFGTQKAPKVISREGMVTPFSTQVPADVYQSHQMRRRSNINIQYKQRSEVSQPISRGAEIINGVEAHRNESRVVLNGGASDSYYTQTPKSVDAEKVTTVTYNSFPTIDSKGEAMNISEEGSIVETGSKQNLPGDWSEPGGPIGDFVFPMLLLVGAYLSIRTIKGFNN